MILGLLLFGFLLFAGLMGYLLFKNGKPYRFQLNAALAIVLLALVMNVGAYFAFDHIVKPLISCDRYDESYGWFAGIQVGGLILSVFAFGTIVGSALGITRSKVLGQIVKTTPVPKTALTSEKGKNAILKCPRCKAFLSLRWIIFSMNTTKHTCKNCGAPLVWTRRRMIVSAIAGGSCAPVFMLANFYFDSFWPGILLIPVMAIPLFLIPGQYRLEE